MQSKSMTWVALSIIFGYFFYHQWAGVNLALFVVCLIVVWGVFYPTASRQLTWRYVAVGLLCSSFCLVWTQSTVALVAIFISLAALMGINLSHHSLLLGSLQSFFNLFAAPISLLDKNNHKANFPTTTTTKTFQPKLLVYAISIGITGFFFILYVQASPIFGAVISKINFSFISWGGVFFTLLGAFILFGCFFPYSYPDLLHYEQQQNDEIQRHANRLKGRDFSLIALRTEYQTGRLLLLLLNVLLAVFIAIEVLYVFIWDILPTGVTQTDFLHQSVHTLIISIVLAIGIILYFFRGNLNFLKQNTLLKYLALLWVALNVVLLVVTFYKNYLYIDNFGLTRKRIGVYFYLLLTFIGLVCTYLKVWKMKSNWFLFRITSWSFYTVLLCASFFSWDNIITTHNLSTTQPNRHIDYDYLIEGLSDSNLPILLEIAQKQPQLFTPTQQQNLKNKKANFLLYYLDTDWQSWTYEQTHIANAIKYK